MPNATVKRSSPPHPTKMGQAFRRLGVGPFSRRGSLPGERVGGEVGVEDQRLSLVAEELEPEEVVPGAGGDLAIGAKDPRDLLTCGEELRRASAVRPRRR